MRLDEARRIAGEWRSQVARGIDPAEVEAERRAAEARERAMRIKHSFTVRPCVCTENLNTGVMVMKSAQDGA
jgi:hypothetical protein